jgi:methylthioribose-1-phosphate isomerase
MNVDRSNAGTNRDRRGSAPVAAWPAGITAAGLAIVTADDEQAQRQIIADAAAAATPSDLQVVVLGADRTNDNGTPNTIADVTGLSFAVAAGSYWFKATVPFTAAAGTTGSRWSINGPASSLIRFRVVTPTSATAESVTHGVAFDEPAACTTDSPTSGLAIIEGIVTPSGAGTVAVRFASEVAGSAIVAKAGATLHWQRLA